MRKTGKHGPHRGLEHPKLTNPNKHKRAATRVLSGKIIPPETEAVTPNPWLDPGWKLFRPRRYKRWSKD